MIVVDASAAVEVLLGAAGAGEVGTALLASAPAVAPAYFDAEVYGALSRSYLRRHLSLERFRTAVDRLGQFDAERLEIVSLLPNVVGLVDVFGAHDVFYVLLAISRGCPLLTCDRGLARAAARLGVTVVTPDGSRPA